MVGVLDQVDENLPRPGQIRPNRRQIWRHLDIDRAIAKRGLAMLQGRVDQLLDRMRFEFQLDFAGVQPRHFSRFAYQAVQAIAFLR